MNTDKTSIENENQPSCLGAVSGSLYYELQQLKTSLEFHESMMKDSLNQKQFDRHREKASELMLKIAELE
jgi:hypothetical protein